MKIAIASPHEVDAVWPQVSGYLLKSCDKIGSPMTVQEAWQICRNGSAYLVVCIGENEIEMASVWRFETWPTGVVLRCYLLGGKNLKKWGKQLREFITDMAAKGGADRLIAEGRKEWGTFFNDAKELWRAYEVRINAG